MSWRLAHSLEVLRAEINARYPNRSKVSDGTIGDAAHASTGSASDHNPWLDNTVRAFDITTDPAIAPQWLAELFRHLGATGDPRLNGGGYIIYNNRIASERDGWAWRAYSGADPHTSHIHLSVSRNAAGYDSAAPWLTTPPSEEDDMTPEQAAQLKAVYEHITTKDLGPDDAGNPETLRWAVQTCVALLRRVVKKIGA